MKNQPTESASSSEDAFVMGPYNYLVSVPGKDMRRQLIQAFNCWLQVPPKSLEIISGVVTILHTASLLVDDIEDNSLLRRGVPTAHQIFGTAQTINSANFMYFLALLEVQKLESPTAISVFTEELLNLHRGQGIELYWRETLTCPTEDEYLRMVGNKTGGLFRLAIKLMYAESPIVKDFVKREDCMSLVNIMGLIFQICDDYLNLCDTTYKANKGLYEDLTEGKFSFPIIHSIRCNPSSHRLISILKRRTDDKDVKHYAVQYMHSTASFEYTRNFVHELHERALLLTEIIDNASCMNGASDEGRNLIEAVLHKMVSKVISPIVS